MTARADMFASVGVRIKRPTCKLCFQPNPEMITITFTRPPIAGEIHKVRLPIGIGF